MGVIRVAVALLTSICEMLAILLELLIEVLRLRAPPDVVHLMCLLATSCFEVLIIMLDFFLVLIRQSRTTIYEICSAYSTEKLNAGYGQPESSSRSVSKGKRPKMSKKERERRARLLEEKDANLRIQHYAFVVKPRQEEAAAKGAGQGNSMVATIFENAPPAPSAAPAPVKNAKNPVDKEKKDNNAATSKDVPQTKKD